MASIKEQLQHATQSTLEHLAQDAEALSHKIPEGKDQLARMAKASDELPLTEQLKNATKSTLEHLAQDAEATAASLKTGTGQGDKA